MVCVCNVCTIQLEVGRARERGGGRDREIDGVCVQCVCNVCTIQLEVGRARERGGGGGMERRKWIKRGTEREKSRQTGRQRGR